MRDANYPTTTTTYGVGHLGLLARLAPLIVMLALTLFPFGWLGELWPAFGHGLDLVFSNDQRHAIGHGWREHRHGGDLRPGDRASLAPASPGRRKRMDPPSTDQRK